MTLPVPIPFPFPHRPPVGSGYQAVTSTVIRPWVSGDLDRLVEAETLLSRASLTARFFTGTSRLPAGYLRHLARVDPGLWDAVVAVDTAGGTGRIVGWAEYGRERTDPRAGELGVMVADNWQRRGLGTRLVRALLPRAIRAGVRTLSADVQETNHAARRALAAAFGRLPVVANDGGIIRYAVPLLRTVEGDAHAG